jgi:hypothetical protein
MSEPIRVEGHASDVDDPLAPRGEPRWVAMAETSHVGRPRRQVVLQLLEHHLEHHFGVARGIV